MKKTLFIYGASGHAKVVAATARLLGYEIGGFWEDSDERVGSDFFGGKIIRFQDVPAGADIFVGFGCNKIRAEVGRRLSERFNIPNLIHPSAQVAESASLGIGNYIGACSNVDPDCRIGSFCIINKCSEISHDSILHDGCHICGGAVLAGGCEIGENTFVGINASVIGKKVIADNVTVGAGAVVISDFPSNVVVVGVPAKIIKRNAD